MTSFQTVRDPFPDKEGFIRKGTAGFYQRPESFNDVLEKLLAGQSVSLVGERKAGKTSFLHYLEANLPATEFIPVFIDVQSIGTKTDRLFLGKLIKGAAQAISNTLAWENKWVPIPQQPTAAASTFQNYLFGLLQILNNRFNKDDLETFCFALGIDFENLHGETKIGKARALLDHLQRRERLPDLIRVGQALRHDIDWEGVPQTAVSPLSTPPALPTLTLTVPADDIYETFISDLERLAHYLPVAENGRKRRIVWLIDEIEVIRTFKETELYSFLRPVAQATYPHFLMVVAGYDVLFTLSTESEWSPLFNAFHHIRLQGLNNQSATKLVTDAVAEKMACTIEQTVCQTILTWTSQKPFFIKWLLTHITNALNEHQTTLHINETIIANAQQLFLKDQNLHYHFSHLWRNHTTANQKIILSLIATQIDHNTTSDIIQMLIQQHFTQKTPLLAQQLLEDFERLQQLGFLDDNQQLTSACLQEWIKQYKPLR